MLGKLITLNINIMIDKIQQMLNDLPSKNYSKLSDKQLIKYENLSLIRKGKKHSEEIKKKMSEVAKGKTYTEQHRKKLSNSHKGKKHSEEVKKKMSEVAKGKIRSNEHRKKLSTAFSKPLYCYSYPSMEFIKEFGSTHIASKELNVNQSCISLVCNGKRKSAHGYTFRYKE